MNVLHGQFFLLVDNKLPLYLIERQVKAFSCLETLYEGWLISYLVPDSLVLLRKPRHKFFNDGKCGIVLADVIDINDVVVLILLLKYGVDTSFIQQFLSVVERRHQNTKGELLLNVGMLIVHRSLSHVTLFVSFLGLLIMYFSSRLGLVILWGYLTL